MDVVIVSCSGSRPITFNSIQETNDPTQKRLAFTTKSARNRSLTAVELSGDSLLRDFEPFGTGEHQPRLGKLILARFLCIFCRLHLLPRNECDTGNISVYAYDVKGKIRLNTYNFYNPSIYVPTLKVKNAQITRLLKVGQDKFGAEFGWKAKFARALGMTPQQLNDYFSGRISIGTEMQERLRKIEVDVEWVMTGKQSGGEDLGASATALQGWAKFEGRIVASPDGKEYFDHSEISEGAGVPYRKGNFFSLEVESNSLMTAEPIPIMPGDICIFESGVQPSNGEIVAVHLKNNKRMVKIIKHLNRDEVELCSANRFQNYPSIKIKKQDIASFGVFRSKLQLTEKEKKFFGLK